MPTSVRLRRFFVPTSIGLILVFAAGWYNLFWLPHRHRYLDDRNFRVLKTLSEQVRLGINNFDKMLDNAADSGIKDDKLNDYLKNVAPQLETPEDEEKGAIFGNEEDRDVTYGDPPKISVVADEGTHFLYMGFKRTGRQDSRGGKRMSEPAYYAVRTDLDQLISRLLPPNNRNPFGIVLVAKQDGTVIFQKSSPGIEISRIDEFEDESTVAQKKAKTGDTGKDKIEKRAPAQASRYSEITLAGARYRLYSQPLELSFSAIENAKKAKPESPQDSAEKWEICGLVRTDAFRSESQSMSYVYMLWLSGALLLAVAAYPFLKLHISSPLERLRLGAVVTIAVFACVVAAAVTFILLDIYYWRYDFDRAAGVNMQTLAEAIDRNFNDEKERAYDQLGDFSERKDLALDLHNAQASPSQLPLLTADGTGCTPSWACQINLLTGEVNKYPYLQFATWSDSNGDQRVKWTIKRTVTPFLNLEKEQAITYYPDVRGALAEIKRASAEHPLSGPTEGIGTQYSATTGDNITIFWKLFDLKNKEVPRRGGVDLKDIFCAALVSHPISVSGPALPDGFQFAVIQHDGLVVFHSDRTKNLRENFFDETDQDQEVRSRVLMRASGPLVANYMGHPHRLYIRPMNSSEEQMWTVVIFRDLHIEDTMNLEMLSLSSIMFVLYATAIALGLVLAHRMGKVSMTDTWLWPDSRRGRAYRWLALANAVAGVLLLLCSQLPAFMALLFCAALLPAGALVCNWLVLKSQKNFPDRVEASPPGWRLHYTAGCTTLLVVLAVLPCLCFTKVACDFEHKLITARGQISLVSAVQDRSKRVRLAYQGVELGAHASTLLSETNAGARPFFSYHHVLRASTRSVRDETQVGFTPPTCGWFSAEARQRCVERFLIAASPAYDQIAADNRYLAETGASFDRNWSSVPARGEQQLDLKIKEPGNTIREVISPWTPLQVPWSDGRWWLGTLALIAALFFLVRWSLRRIFQLDLVVPVLPGDVEAISERRGLIANLSMNLLVIGPATSPTIAGLINRQGVQAWDLRDILNITQQSARTADGSTFVMSSTGDQVDEIIRDGRPVVFYNCETTFENPRGNHQSLAALERVMAGLGNKVVITSEIDPASKAPSSDQEQWRNLLQSFVRVDVPASDAQSVDESAEQFESRISAQAYQRWRFYERTRPQKLVLVHLAQEGLVSPNSREIVSELVREGVVERRWGRLAITDDHFAEFVKHAISADSVRHWEEQGLESGSASLGWSLLVLGAGLAGFLIYTQGEVLNTWVTYATGLAAAIPAFMKMIATVRGKSMGAA